MTRSRLLGLALLSWMISTPIPAVAEGAPQPLSVLFLGDQGHHRPAERAEQLVPVLASRGIELTYTNQRSALNAETLAKYDALMVYANMDEIGASQEKALLDFVEGGGGFVPLHCASSCFGNSRAYVALVGGQFLRHGTGTFDTKVVDPEHPIMKGLRPFPTWDETYVHVKLAKDRHDLQTRPEGDLEEPWTWTRTQGKGRVFYTAYGHDERTWGHPGFHDLVERGIRWAAPKGNREVADGRPRVAAGLKPFTYEEAKDRIPNYLPGKSWGTQGETIRTMQAPLPPEESRKHLALPQGFAAKLFAAEPEIGKPLCLAWDHRGRLWIAETVDYPNDKRPPGEGRDRIKVCEDTDGDGLADTFTVFAEGLSIPTSLVFANGGLVIHQAPDTLFLKDTDGDGVADVRKVLFTGWDVADTHAGPSNLRYGLDNWIYGIVGYAGFQGVVGGQRHAFRMGFYRFLPDGSKLEFLRNTNNNSWGVGFTEEGFLFGSTANGCPSVFAPIPNRDYEKVRGWSAGVLANIADSNRFFPATEKVRQVDWHGGFTAGAGSAIYTARAYPQVYWNRTAFVAEPTGHLVATFTLHDRGADFAAHNAWNLLASDDEWTSPIVAEVGPDGNVWIIDWYNYIVQHNPTPQGFQNGRGNAYETSLRDKTHGRIYRIVHRDSKATAPVVLHPDDPDSLVAGLKSDNMFWRTHAQRLLVERGKQDVVPALAALTRNPAVDAKGLNTAAIHALWTLRGLGSDPESATETALRHPSPGVRRNAVMSFPGHLSAGGNGLVAKLFQDADAHVRVAAFLAVAELAPSATLADALVDALTTGRADEGRTLGEAMTIAAAVHDRHFLKAIASRNFDRPASGFVGTVVRRVAEHFAREGPVDEVGTILAGLSKSDKIVAEATIAGLAAGWPKDRPTHLDEAQEQALLGLLVKVSPETQGLLASMAARMGSHVFEAASAEIAKVYRTTASDAGKPDKERTDAARQLIDLRKSDAAAAKDLLDLINPRTPPALAVGIIEAIGRSEASAVGAPLAEAVPTLTPAVRPTALRVLLSRGEWTAALLDVAEKGDVDLSQLALDQKQALAAHPDQAIAGRSKKWLAGGGGLPDPDRQKVIDEISPVALAGGDADKGKLVFKEQCAKCHTHGGEGGKVGPDLTGIAAHPKSELLIHILDPSRSVEGNFVQYNLATTDGRVLNGLLASENKAAVELLDAEGKTHVVLRDDIDALVASRKSVMPEGFEKQIPAKRIADLLEFLARRGKYLPLDMAKAATVVTTRGMFYDHENKGERLVFDDWSPKTFEGIPFLLVDPRGDRVPNAIMLYGPTGTYPPKMPKSVRLACNAPAKAIHLLSGISGWGALDDKAARTVTMIVRLHYADGSTEDHPLKNGVHFADYIRVVDVPGSKLAFKLREQQLRYLAVHPKRFDKIDTIEFLKGDDATAPVVMAATVEGAE